MESRLYQKYFLHFDMFTQFLHIFTLNLGSSSFNLSGMINIYA